MFEGKHIHFSPVDNKPLCSYSSKLCRQRRLNGYAFCIRHILEDESAPFKRCTYVTRNNNQICQNAIPTSQERGYCHSHMQVAGIIPKTERKIKNPSKAGQDNLTSIKSDSNSNSSTGSSSLSSATSLKKDPNAVFKFEEEPTEIQWIPKGGRINGIVNGKGGSGLKGSDALKKGGGIEKKINLSVSEDKNTNAKEVNGEGDENGISDKSPALQCRQTYSKKKVTAASAKAIKATKDACVSNTGENEMQHDSKTRILQQSIMTSDESKCVPENLKYFDQLKTLKCVEKSVDSETSTKQPNNDSKKADPPCSLKNQKCSSAVVISLLNCAQNLSSNPFFIPTAPTIKSLESRQEFLARVRNAFKSQYLTIKNAAKDNDKNEKIWKRALRNSLLTCVVKDSSHCAHVIVQNDPKKYSDLNGNNVTPNLLKSKKPVSKGTRNERKNGIIGDFTPNQSSSPRGSNFDILNSCKETEKSKLKVKISSISAQEVDLNLPQRPNKGRGLLVKTQQDDNEHLVDQNKQNKTLNEKTPIMKSSGVHGVNSKKRKIDMLGQDTVTSTTFRIPKLEDSSDVDMKVITDHEGQHPYNNFNGRVSNRPLLHPHSGSAITNLKATVNNAQAQLQHLLSQPDLRTLASSGIKCPQRNQGIDTVLNSVGSSDLGTSDGVITDASFDSTFEHSVSSQRDCEFSDDDLERSLEFQIDPETEHQASRLLEDNELTEDDLNELFPETSNKLSRSDLSDLGDFSSAFDATDIDYSLFANIFPFNRTSQSESISVSNQY